MNAYELAEQAEGLAYEIPADWSSGEPKNVATDIADMLRQQADRIAELENQLDKYSHYEAMTHQEYMKEIAELKEEKIKAYDNGFEDGRKSLQELAKYQQQAAELWNDSCTSNRSTK